MRRSIQFIHLLGISLFLFSCSFNKIVVNRSSDLIQTASLEVQSETNYENFKSGLVGNLILIEGLLSQSPDNLDILATLTKGYAGYAFAVNETDMLNEEWGELKTETGKSQALLNYTRAFNFGLRYLKLHDIELSYLISQINLPSGISDILNKNLSGNAKDLELVLFTAESLAALINLQKDNMSMIAELPIMKAMFDWVCLKDPKINYGTCPMFYGAYESGRPKMLGGNPEKGKDIFLKAIANYPHNWLIRSAFMQYYLIPQNDQTGFGQQLDFLKKKQTEFNSFHVYSADNQSSKEVEWNQEAHLRFYQALGLKRYELMNKYKNNFF